MKKLIGMLAGAFCLALAAMMINPIQASAAGRTVRITYDITSDAWYEQIDGGYWTATGGNVVDIQDGDTVVVDAANQTPTVPIHIITDKRIAELAVTGKFTFTINLSTPADLVYASNGATLIYNGDAKKVYFNAGCIVQISGNVDYAEVKYVNNLIPVFAVTGTVGEFHGKLNDGKMVTDVAYDFAPGTVHSYEDGVVYVEEGSLKGAPASAGSNGSTGNGPRELDEVPRTGSGVNTSIVFFALAVVLAITAVTVKRRESVKQ